MTKGYYGGGTFGVPTPIGGVGGGLYMDNYGRMYPQLYWGTPKFGFSGGYTPNLEGLLKGLSISGSPGVGPIRPNVGGNFEAGGAGIGTPGFGATYGLGPLEMSNDYSHPWAISSIRDSAARAGVPGRNNVWEYDYPDSNVNSSPPAVSAPALRGGQEASRPTPAFAPDAVYSPMGDFFGNFRRTEDADRTSERYLARRTPGQTQGSVFNAGAPAASPVSPEGLFSLNDACLEYRRRLEADRSQLSPDDAGAAVAPLVPSADANFSGGLLGRLTALLGVDPQNPNQLMPPPPDDELRAFYRDDAVQPWAVQRRR